MLKPIFKMIWKRRKTSRLILAEMFISFLLLFGLSVALLKILTNYFQPLGFEYKDVWVLNIDPNLNVVSEEEVSARRELFSLLTEELRTMPGVVNIASCASNLPYQLGFYENTVTYEGNICRNAIMVETDKGYPAVVNLDIHEGRWFDNNDVGQKEIPVVLNTALKEILFNNKSAIGQVIDSGKYKVVGIVRSFKIKGEFAENSPTCFMMIEPGEYAGNILIKSGAGAGEAFGAQLIDRTSELTKDWTLNVSKLIDSRKERFTLLWTPVIISGSIIGFLIINILLGLMGLLWYNISRRRSEIALRRSVGAPANKIIQQFTGEMLALATLGMIPGLLIAVQFPILGLMDIEAKVYAMAILATILLIYLLVIICSYLPGSQAAKLHPASLLHEE